MWEVTVGADLDSFAVLFYECWITRAVSTVIHRAVAEETVKVCKPFMAREVFTIIILKKSV